MNPRKSASATSAFDVARVRADFPILEREVHGQQLVYLDNAATTQKPQPVIDVLNRYYSTENANIHRGVHYLSEYSTKSHDTARTVVQRFLNARSSSEIIFTRNATEGINLIAQTYGRQHAKPGDEIVITTMEHHSNIVPWQLLCEQTGACLRVAPIDDTGELQLDEFEALLGPRTKLVSIVHLSNSLGTINPVKKIIDLAHQQDIPVLVDGAQSAYHMPIDVQALDCDFFVLTGHKIYGPTGIGVLYGKSELLDTMPPYQGGGDMINSVTFAKTTYSELPHKFEAGTPNIAQVIGLGSAVDYLSKIGMDKINAHETAISNYAVEKLNEIDEVTIYGNPPKRGGVVTFNLHNIHPHDLAQLLDKEGVAIRAGHHCAQPLMDKLGVTATARASFYLYNDLEDIDKLVAALIKSLDFLG